MDGTLDLHQQTELIRQVFLYHQRFRDKVFVIQIDSAIIGGPAIASLVRDLSLLHQSGIRIVLVAGAGSAIDAVLEVNGLGTQRAHGVRISSAKSIPFIKMAAFDAANILMTQLASYNLDAVIGNWVRAKAIGVIDGIDFEQSGIVDRVNMALLQKTLHEGLVPILPCIGWNSVGKPYNISSQELATHLAGALHAEKLFFVGENLEPQVGALSGNHDGMTLRDDHLTRMNEPAARRELLWLETQGRAYDPLAEYIRLGLRALGGGVRRVHLLNGSIDGVVLKEIFSTLGQGLMFHHDDFESIRPMDESDIPAVLNLISPLVASGALVARTKEDLLKALDDYVLFVADGNVLGCAALHSYGPGAGAEVAALAVDGSYGHLGIGQKLMNFMIKKGKSLSLPRLFVLTTKTTDYFESLGFVPGTLEDLPEEKRTRYNAARKSRIMILPL